MGYTKLLHATLIISTVLVFYIFLYYKIRNERIDEFIKAKYRLWHSRNFDLYELIRDEVKRSESLDSCNLCIPGDRQGQARLRLVSKKIKDLTTTFNEAIHSHYTLNHYQCCIELLVQNESYYITVQFYSSPRKLRNFFSRKRKNKYCYILTHKSSRLYESADLFLVMKMLVRSLIQEIGPDTLFRPDILVPTTYAPTTGNASVRRPGT